MAVETISVAQARNDFSDLLAKVELLQRRYVIARCGRPKAVLVSVEDWARLEALEQGTPHRPRRNVTARCRRLSRPGSSDRSAMNW